MNRRLVDGELDVSQSEGYRVRFVSTLDVVTQEDWDRCLGAKGSPFLTYAFLRGLELCDCVGEGTGWSPRYLLLERQDELIGAVAAYHKEHSQGEFIFDWSWADAAH
jgi:predicted N-acyltransferase